MSLHMQIQTAFFGAYSNVDLVANQVAKVVYRASYGHPTMLSWVMYQPQQTMPLGLRNFIRFWDDAGTLNGSGQGSGNPLFEGFIEDIQPADSNLLTYVAYDPTYETTRNVTVMNLAYPQGTVPTTPPVDASGAFPRLVFNATIDNDDDYAFCYSFKQTIAQQIWAIFNNCYQPLYWYNAAPGDGSSAGNGTPYVVSDLFTGSGGGSANSGIDYVPQEKEVFESESVRSAVDRLLRYAPQFRMMWYPGARKWRIFDITASGSTTLTLNQHNAGSGPEVLSFDVKRSLDNRYTAVRFYGPEVATYTEAKVSDGSLTQFTDFSVILQNTATSCCTVYGVHKWQITDPTKRSVARLLQTPIYVNVGDFSLILTRSPTLQAYWPQTSAANFPGWRLIIGWILDAFNGIIDTGQSCVYRYNPYAVGGEVNFEIPTDVKFAYGLPTNPLQVRYPTTGFQGTAYSVANLTNELKLYDEMLAIGYEWNNPVTSAARLAQYAALANYELNLRQDIYYAGGAVLDGLQYQFALLNQKINIASTDGSGGTKTTGWENIGAFLTDCEIDFENQLTTLTFGSDHLELLGLDVEEEKKRLKIRALVQVWYAYATLSTHIRPKTTAEAAQGFDSMIPVIEQTETVKQGFLYVDPLAGTVDNKSQVGRPGAAQNQWPYRDPWTGNYNPGLVAAGYLPAGSLMSVGGSPWGGGDIGAKGGAVMAGSMQNIGMGDYSMYGTGPGSLDPAGIAAGGLTGSPLDGGVDTSGQEGDVSHTKAGQLASQSGGFVGPGMGI